MGGFVIRLLVFIVATALCVGCLNERSQTAAISNPPVSQPAQPIEEQQHIEFKGVKFTYDRTTFGSVTPSEVPEVRLVPDEKPDSVAPRHVTFRFELNKRYNEAHLTIYPVSEFVDIVSAHGEYQRRTRQQFKELGSVLRDKDLRFDGEIPFIPYREGGQEILAKVKLSDFQNGRGIFFVTHWAFEAGLISNELLYYVFEGLTHDGKHYVVAEMPVNVGFLPETSPEEYEGFRIDDLYADYKDPNSLGKRHKHYRSTIASRLDALPAAEFRPDLRHLEDIISSLEIGRK